MQKSVVKAPYINTAQRVIKQLCNFYSVCGNIVYPVVIYIFKLKRQIVSVIIRILVGSLAYLYTLAHGACTARMVNNFFCGLFHDLPELLTRDIISPVKQSSDELARLIREYEAEELDRRIFASLRTAKESILGTLLGYYLGLGTDSEFCERILLPKEPEAETRALAGFAELDTKHDTDAEHPLDGQIVKACDLLGAYLEAYESIKSGVSSTTLTNAIFRLTSQLKNTDKVPSCMHLASLLADFD